MSVITEQALNEVDREMVGLRRKVAALLAEREAWNNSFHQANSERLKLQEQVDRLTEEKEAWKRDAEALAEHLPNSSVPMQAHRALVEKYK